MRTVKSILISFIIFSSFALCTSQTTEKNNESQVTVSKIDVYYFHFTRRCLTCNAVEDESKKALETLYPKQVKAGTITFQSINLDEEGSNEISKKLDIAEQALLIVKGNTKINLTNEGFMYARSNPEKLKAKIKAEVDKLL
ncbi:MAG: hypothetical protein H8E98_02290 [Bacteroidetes bacterium]|nr:hypothetical protein [Bacteroidota bacterium]